MAELADAHDSKSCGAIRAGSSPATGIKKRCIWRFPDTAFFMCAPSGARFQRVKVPNPPGSGKDIVEGKGVHREVESEGSWMWGTH